MHRSRDDHNGCIIHFAEARGNSAPLHRYVGVVWYGHLDRPGPDASDVTLDRVALPEVEPGDQMVPAASRHLVDDLHRPTSRPPGAAVPRPPREPAIPIVGRGDLDDTFSSRCQR